MAECCPRNNLWILVSEGDRKAYPGMTAVTDAMEKAGATVLRSRWDGTRTPEELTELFQSEQIYTDIWIREESFRKQAYREKLGSGDRVVLMQMICTLYRHKERQLAAGKKVHQCDENFLRDAEKLLAGEVGIVLDMPYPEALAYVRQNLKQ